MRIAFALLFLITIHSQYLLAQASDEKISVFKKQLKESEEDTSRVSILNDLAKLYKSGKTDSALYYIEESVELAEKLEYQKGIATALFHKGGYYRRKNKYDSALIFFNESKVIFEKIEDQLSQAKVLNESGLAYRTLGQYQEAIDAHHKAYTLNIELENNNGAAGALNNEGSARMRFGQISEAINLHNEALELSRATGDTTQQAQIMTNLGNIHLNRGEYEDALNYYLPALEMHQANNDKNRAARLMNNIALVYGQRGEYIKSLDLNQQILVIQTALGDQRRIAQAKASIGNIYNYIDVPKKALNNHQEALDIYLKINYKVGIAITYNQVAADYAKLDSLDQALRNYQLALKRYQKINKCYEIFALQGLGDVYYQLNQFDSAYNYYDLGLRYAVECKDLNNQAAILIGIGVLAYEEGNFRNAEKKLLEGRELAIETGSAELQRQAAEILYKNYKSLNNPLKALEFHEEYQAVNDSLFGQESTRKLALAEAEFNFNREKEQLVFKQEKETIKLEEEKKLLNTRLVAVASGLFLLLIAAGFIGWAYRAKNKTAKQLKTANDKLHQLDQFKTRLFANINHDFRTPLTLIQGYTLKITEDENNFLSGASEENLKHLQRNAVTMTEMTNEIQDLLLLEESKLKLSFSKVTIHEHVARLVKMFDSMAQIAAMNLTFHSSVNPDVIVHIDQGHFDKIFYNLVSNAFRYTPKGGAITVKLDSEENTLKLVVSDTGKGIDPKDQPHVFDRFYQSPLNEYRSKEGFGIGLAVVRELLQLHGGEISLSSELGVGTKFTVLLPFNLDQEAVNLETLEQEIKSEILPTKEANTTMLSTAEDNRYTILVVDDHEEIREYIAGLIAKNYHVKEAGNGNQALELLAKNHVDLILTDLMMPWLDGYDLIEKLQQDERLKKIPVMVVSARTTEEDKHRILDAGVNEFISKPFDPTELQKRINNILTDKRKQVNVWEDVAKDQDTQSNLENNIVKKLNQIIIGHVSNPNLTTELIATELSASRSKAIRLIKELTGQTPLAYVKAIRMGYIDEMIKTKKIKNATEAAKAIGMTHATQFANQYKKHFGFPPNFSKEE